MCSEEDEVPAGLAVVHSVNHIVLFIQASQVADWSLLVCWSMNTSLGSGWMLCGVAKSFGPLSAHTKPQRVLFM